MPTSLFKSLVLGLILALSQPTFAQENEMDPAETYTLFCGSSKALSAWAKANGQNVTTADLREMSEQRSPLLNVLKNGERAIQDLLTEGSKSDTGPFGAILTCGMIVQLKSEILAKGCYDLKTNKPVRDSGGILACENLMARLPK